LGLIYASIGLIDNAKSCLENAFRLAPRNWWYAMQLIQFQLQLKHYDRAIEIANRIQKVYPEKPEIYNLLASLYKQTKSYDKAIGAYEKLENLTGIDQSISFEKFRLYVLSNRPKKGIAEIDKLIHKFPTEDKFKVFRGDIFMEQKMPEKAYQIYMDVLKDDSQNALAYVSLSEYYKQKNQPEKAMECIVTALKNDQLDIDTKMNILGQTVEKLVQDSSKITETDSLFRLLIDRYPLEEQVHGYYAQYLQFRGRNAKAISELETMININPKNNQTWLRLIQIYISEQKFKQVVEITSRAIVNVPKVPVWYFYRGIADYQLGEYFQALQAYQDGLIYIQPDQGGMKSDFYAQMGDIYFKLEKKDSAFISYENALVANPKNLLVMNNYAYYLSLNKQALKKAERMSAKTVESEPKNSTYLDTYAWILYQEGNNSLAKFYIERAMDNLDKTTDSSIIFEHYGDILWVSGKDDAKALEMWKKSYDSGNKTDELKQKIDNKGWKR
jgi:tetratricopeptide (TPR) repeat protein